MKTLYILAALCAIHMTRANPVNTLEELVNEQTQIVHKVLEDLDVYKTQVSKDFETKIVRSRIEGHMGIHNVLDRVILDVAAAATDAVEQGKDAEHCIEEIQLKAGNVSVESRRDMLHCSHVADQRFQSTLAPLAEINTFARAIEKQILSILPSCNSSDFEKMKSCVERQVAKVKVSVDELSETAESLKESISSVVEHMVRETRECIALVVINAAVEIPKIKSAGEECVKNA